MGQEYVRILSYGMIVKARNCPNIKALLKEYEDVIGWRQEGVPTRTHGKHREQIFVYFKSMNKEWVTRGEEIDTHGTPFDPPKHPRYLKTYKNCKMPEDFEWKKELTEREKEARREIENQCTVFVINDHYDVVPDVKLYCVDWADTRYTASTRQIRRDWD